MIGIFTDDFYPPVGGMGEHVFSVYRAMDDDAIVFSPAENRLPNHIRVHPPFHKRLYNISYSIWLNTKLGMCIDLYDLDRVHLHCGVGGLFLLSKQRVPVIITCHHTYWQQSIYINSQRWKKVFIPFERATYQRSDRVICVSRDTRDVLVREYGIEETKVTVIPNGVNTENYFPMDGVDKEPRSLLYVGRIDGRKGVDFLVSAIPAVRDRYPDVKLYIGGKGEATGEIRRIISENGLSRNVDLLGYIPEEQLNTWYNRVECVVVPSRLEGFGLTVIEAMAAGTPVIGTRVDGIKTVIDHRQNGLLVSPESSDDLAERIIQVFASKELREKLRQGGLRSVVERYTLKQFTDRTKEVLESAKRYDYH